MNGRYISVSPWLCAASRCSPLIGRYLVYVNRLHITATYSVYLERVLAERLQQSMS
jgi:hypothetical protein